MLNCPNCNNEFSIHEFILEKSYGRVSFASDPKLLCPNCKCFVTDNPQIISEYVNQLKGTKKGDLNV